MGVLMVAALLRLAQETSNEEQATPGPARSSDLCSGLGLTLFVASQFAWGWMSPTTIVLGLVAMAALVVFRRGKTGESAVGRYVTVSKTGLWAG